jgi:hypothetical protein
MTQSRDGIERLAPWSSRPLSGSLIRSRLDLPLVALVLCAVAAVTTVPIAVTGENSSTYTLACLLVALTAWPLVWQSSTRTADAFSPITCVAAIVAVTFAGRAIYVSLFSDGQSQVALLGARPYHDYFPGALAVSAMGFVALSCGYLLGPKRRPSWRQPRYFVWSARPPTARILGLLLVGAIATIVRVVRGEVVGRDMSDEEVTSLTFVLGALTSCTQFAAGAAALYLHSPRRTDRAKMALIVWLGALPISVLQSLVFGTKTPVLMSIFVTIGALHYAGRRVRLRTLFGAGLVTVLLVFPTVNAYRSTVAVSTADATGNVSNFVQTLRDLREHLSDGSIADYFQLSLDNLMARSTGVDSLSLVMKYGGGPELRRRADYLLIPAFAFIPRILWPTKPTGGPAVQFGRVFILSSEEASNSYTSFGIYHMGDLYLNFSLPGVIIGMFILGAVYRFTYEYLTPAAGPHWKGRIFIYLFSLWVMMNGFEGDIPTVYGNLLKSLVVFCLAAAFIARGARTSQREAAA